MAINQSDKVIRQIMVGDKPHEICSKYLGGYTYDEIHQEIQDSVGSGIEDLALTPFKNVTYYDLVNLRNNGLLVPGQSYRIIDYVTTTTQENTKSAKHNFDIIVKALNNNTLSENAKACRCFNSKRDHGVENTTSDIYNWPDVNNWAAYGTSNGGPTLPPDAIELMGNSSVSTQIGTRSITSNSKIRITLLGKKSDDTAIRGFGAALIQNNTIIDIDFGNGTEFYLQLPSGYSDGSYELRFYAYGTASELIDGIAGACAESFDATSHFNDSDLNAWEIKYSLDNDTTRFAWADTVNGKGVIYYMKDEFNNECWYDFKNIQFNCVVKQTHNNEEVEFRPDGYDYAYTFTDYDGNDLSLFSSSSSHDNTIKPFFNNGTQNLNNTIFISNYLHSNVLKENNCNNIFWVSSCYYNNIGNGFQKNYIAPQNNGSLFYFHNNTIGNLFKSNRICSTFNRNVIGNTTNNCDFFSAFVFNKLGDNSWHIDFNYPISYCVFGSYIQYCVFHNTDAYQPAVSEMKWCTIGDGLEGVQYIPCCQKVTFENRVLYNSSSNFHINDVVLNDGTKLVEQLVQQHEDQLYVCSVDDGYTVFRYKNTVSEINLGTFDSIESVASKAAEIDICSNQNITRISFKIDNDGRRYANGFIEQFISGGPYTVSGTELYYIVQTLNFNGETSSRQITYKFIDGVKTIHGVGNWYKIIDHDNSNTESPILYSRSSEVVNIASSQTIIGNKRFDSDINLAGKTIIKNGSNIDKGEFKVFNATDSGAGFTIRTNGKFDNSVPILEMLATNNRAAYKYRFPQLKNTTDHDFVVVKSQLDDEKKYVCIEWEELVTLRNNNELKPGRKYRITDYVTTTLQLNTQSAGHRFDIIVEALSENTLSEDAKAIQNENDGYFDAANLEAWELKYCLDNDTSRFTWAIENSGKGVIYYMKDEFNNECPYDFKNIQFVRYKLNPPTVGGYDSEWENQQSKNVNEMFENNQLSYIWHGSNSGNCYWNSNSSNVFSTPTREIKSFYTFSNVINDEITDKSLTNVCFSNIIKEHYENGLLKLNNNIFFSVYTHGFCRSNIFGNNCSSNSFGDTCYSNIFGNNCYSNSFGDTCYFNSFGNFCYFNSFGNTCYFNSFGNSCSSNSFGDSYSSNSFSNSCFSNILGNNCSSNIFGNNCTYNAFGNNCSSNSFGNSCDYNIFGNNCSSNSFGNSCDSNSFGDYCGSNIFGNSCVSNIFGNSCVSNIFGNTCYLNSFGDECTSNSFGDECHNNGFYVGASYSNQGNSGYIVNSEKLNYVRNITISEGCEHLLVYTNQTTNSNNYVQNITIAKGVKSISSGGRITPLTILISDANNEYEIKVAKNTSGQLKIYCEADLIA